MRKHGIGPMYNGPHNGQVGYNNGYNMGPNVHPMSQHGVMGPYGFANHNNGPAVTAGAGKPSPKYQGERDYYGFRNPRIHG